MKKTLYIIAALVIAAGAFYYFGPYSQRGKDEPTQAQQRANNPTVPRVEVVEVSSRDIFRKGYNESSTLDPVEEVVIYPKVSARILEIKAEEGDPVKKGELLAELDHRDIDAQISSIKAQIAVARASLESAEANYQNALKERDRYRRLVKEGFTTTQQLDVKETAYLQAKSQVSLSKATVDQNRSELQKQQVLLSEYYLKSPLNGKVVDDYSLSIGAVVSPTTPAFHVANVSQLEAIIRAPQERAVNFRENMIATVQIDSLPMNTFEGRIRTISPVVDRDTRTVKVKVVLDNSEGLLKPGMFAQVFIVERQARNALVIPTEAARADDGNRYVFVVSDDVARRVDIDYGIETSRELEIKKGLSEGDKVVISGGESLSDGDRVAIR